MSLDERILVVPRNHVENHLGKFQGYLPFTASHFPLLDIKSFQFLPRSEVEDDPTLKQIIPYIYLYHWQDGIRKIVTYLRGQQGGEDRLHALRSLGFGGHVRQHEGETAIDTVLREAVRELIEEVGVNEDIKSLPHGWINDDSNPVGSVHLGLVYSIWLEDAKLHSNEAEGISDLRLDSPSLVQSHLDEYEPWSQLVFNAFHIFQS